MTDIKNEDKMSNDPKTQFKVEIIIGDKNLSYRSDFTESETIFWLEAVKKLIIEKTFEAAGLSENKA
jgi:hypothetical protein